MRRTTVFGVFAHGICGALETAAPESPAHAPRQTLWRICSKACAVCAGATERPITFPDNDRPRILLAGAARAYANRWAAAPARRVAVFTNNDDGHCTAADLSARGITVVALVDTRADTPDCPVAETFRGAQVVATRGRLRLTGIPVRLADGRHLQVACGAPAVSGGWNPNLHLGAQQRTRPVWSDAVAAFLPAPGGVAGQRSVGAAAGTFSTAGALAEGAAAARAALADLGIDAPEAPLPHGEDAPTRIAAFRHLTGTKGRASLDFQNDVTVKDVALAQQEGFRSVEHVKRYTTLGMATDQGRTANTGAIGVMAVLAGREVAETGTTMFRPP